MNESRHWALDFLRRWWWLMVLGIILPMPVSIYLVSRQTDYYRARATLMVGTSLQNPDPDTRMINLSNYLATAYARLATEGPVLEEVIEKLDLPYSSNQLKGAVSTQVYRDAGLLEIAVVDTDPQRAADIANAIAEALIARTPGSREEYQQQQQFIEQQLAKLEQRIRETEEEINTLRDHLPEITSAAELAEAQQRLKELEDIRSTDRSNYASLLELYRTEMPNTLSLFEPATPPARPIPKHSWQIVLAASVLGLGLTAGAAYIVDLLDDSLRWSPGGPNRIGGMPIFGVVSHLPIKAGEVLEPPDPLSPSAEALRSLRAHILLHCGAVHPQVLLVTSASPRAGKSVVSHLLAWAFATGGKRVALVDADLRHPGLHEHFQMPNLFGLSDFLQQPKATDGNFWEKALVATDEPNLLFLPAGRPPIDPTLWLTRPAIRELITALLAQAEMIIFDSPPERMAPEVTELASLADVIVMVGRQGRTSRHRLLESSERLRLHRAEGIFGVVVNDVRLRGRSYTYYTAYRRESRRRFFKPVTTAEGKTVIGVAEMAEMLGVSRSTVRRWCRDGRLPAFRRRMRWWCGEEEFRALLEQWQEGVAAWPLAGSKTHPDSPSPAEDEANHDDQPSA